MKEIVGVAAGLCAGIFVGAVGLEVLKKTKIAQKSVKKVSEGFRATKDAFKEGFQKAYKPSARPSPEGA